jgi:hypothetical protein
MPIDPSIALGVKPIQFESPINQMAKVYEMQNAQQSNQLNQMKMDEYQRGIANTERRNALFGSFTPDMTPDAQINALIKGGYLDEAKSLAESTAKVNADKRAGRSSELDALTKAHGIFKTTMSSIIAMPTLANAINTVRKTGRMLGEDVEDDVAELTALGDNPTAIRQWAAGHALEADKLLPKSDRVDIGGSYLDRTIDPLTGLPKVVGTTQKTLAPGEAQRIGFQKQSLDLERQRLALGERRDIVSNQQVSEDGTVTNFNKFGEVIGTVKGVGKPSAQFTKTKEQTKRLNTDLNLAITELENATKDGGLIDQSTGSGLGKAMDVTRAFITGGAGTGAIAGAKLGPIADLALKMVPRFEGPQSDKDTQSYKEAAGQLANTSIPNEIRKQAGRTVLRLMKNRKNQFVSQDMAQEGIVPSAGGGIDASNPLLN